MDMYGPNSFNHPKCDIQNNWYIMYAFWSAGHCQVVPSLNTGLDVIRFHSFFTITLESIHVGHDGSTSRLLFANAPTQSLRILASFSHPYAHHSPFPVSATSNSFQCRYTKHRRMQNLTLWPRQPNQHQGSGRVSWLPALIQWFDIQMFQQLSAK